MKRIVLAMLLFVVSVAAETQQRSVQVRLFWQHPPAQISIVPQGATLRSCERCAATRLKASLEITAKGSSMTTPSGSSPIFYLTGQVRISGNGFPPFTIDNELRIQAREDLLLLTLTMPLDEYVTAVLQGESASFKSDEALKAMAVAARTYAVRFGSRHRLEGFDFCDTTHCQDLRLGNESPRARAAAAATEGELLWFEGRPAATYYHRSCGGEIEDAKALEPDLHVRYLKRHHDDYCVRIPDEWQSEISKTDLARALGRPVASVRVVARGDSGRVQRLLISDRAITATDFRLAVGRILGWDKLRSDLYEEEDLGDRILFRGRGQGHGVGLCQRGAESMGEQGHSYREILAYYYPGTELGINAQGLSWEKQPGDSLDLISTDRNDAPVLLPAAEHALHFAIERTGLQIGTRPQLKVYPTVAVYRDATGEPGWVAASTFGSTVRLQPVSTLQRTQSLGSTLRHEFLHMLIEGNAKSGTPLWFREGLAVYLAGDSSGRDKATMSGEAIDRVISSRQTQAEVRLAYRQAAALVRDLDSRYTRPKLIDWLRNGLPDDVRRSAASAGVHEVAK
jgi:stage II sporulation protein D